MYIFCVWFTGTCNGLGSSEHLIDVLTIFLNIKSLFCELLSPGSTKNAPPPPIHPALNIEKPLTVVDEYADTAWNYNVSIPSPVIFSISG